jgi:hypothetical protein
MMVDVLDDTRQDATGWTPPPVPKDPARGRRRRRDAARRGDGDGNGGGGHTAKARREGRFDARNSWQVIAGSILIPLGVVLILIGWYGAAHANVVQQQIPYMVSGSFVGLGCMIVGGLLYWGHWLYRIYDQSDLQHTEQLRVLEAIAASLAGGTIVPAGGRPTGDAGIGAAAGTYYATASGTVYHRDGCAVVAHHPEDLRVLGVGSLGGLRPCQICLPGDAVSG